MKLSLAHNPPVEFTALLQKASEQARELGHSMVCPEHLLLALALSGESERFLRGRGLDHGKLRKQVVAHIGNATESPGFLDCLSIRALGAVRLAEDTAMMHRRDWTPLYLLWALIQDADCDACKILIAEGVDLENWTAALEERMGEPTRRRPGVFTLAPEESAGHRAELRHWRDRLKDCAAFLNEKVLGQPDAVERVSQALVRAWAGLKEAGRPLAGLLFVGPPGVGKTTLATALAQFLYHDHRRCLRFDMHSLSEEGRFKNLMGSSEHEGMLPRLIREYPYSVLCFEDMHRATPRFYSVMSEILSTGQTFDGRGQRLEFRDALVVLHVNVESEMFNAGGPLGFRRAAESSRLDRVEETLMPELKRVLGPELLGAIDDVVFFRNLPPTEMVTIMQKWSEELDRRLQHRRGIRVTVEPGVLSTLARRAREMDEGAAALQRYFIREVENSLAQAMLEGAIEEGDTATMVLDGEEPVWRTTARRNGRVAGRGASAES